MRRSVKRPQESFCGLFSFPSLATRWKGRKSLLRIRRRQKRASTAERGRESAGLSPENLSPESGHGAWTTRGQSVDTANLSPLPCVFPRQQLRTRQRFPVFFKPHRFPVNINLFRALCRAGGKPLPGVFQQHRTPAAPPFAPLAFFPAHVALVFHRPHLSSSSVIPSPR